MVSRPTGRSVSQTGALGRDELWGRMTYSVDKHVALELGVVQETLLATIVVALELSVTLGITIGQCEATYQLVTVHCHVLLQRGPVVEYFAARVQMALESLHIRATNAPARLRPDTFTKHRDCSLLVRNA